ncbi:LysR family transcriptional regulator [Actinomadura alba]|uniref:LysR family transcriptional regulator n=1 Tax=Actinomadura alba TaxID=406431 RepID=A0ABR7LMX7_9ACTN|nr:LysR family transcriptional regulator [Actinomadura alba]MBC6465837.1 LysR family transcriptional regulator [Actinomadura alba]
MNLQQLRYAVALADELHFGRAARRAGVQQPPFSQQIRRLENELGVTLFERTTRHVRLTPAGEAFVIEARRALTHLEAAAQAAGRVGRGETGRLMIGFVGSAVNQALPPVLRRYRSRYPGVDLELRELTTAQQVEELIQGRLDIGVLRAPIAGPRQTALTTITVARERFVVALPIRHPLSAREHVPLPALAADAFVLPPRSLGPGFHDQITRMARAAGFELRVVQEAVQMQTIVGLVAAGIGVSIVPESVGRLHRDDVVFRPLTPLTRAVTLDLAWRRDDASPLVRNFREMFAPAGSQAG